MDRPARFGRGHWVGLGGALLGLVAGGLILTNWSNWQCRYLASQYRAATTEDVRAEFAQQLIHKGPIAWPWIAEQLQSSESEQSQTMAQAVVRHLLELEPGSPDHSDTLAKLIGLESSPTPATQAQFVALVPLLLRSEHPDAVRLSRDWVRAGLSSESADIQVAAIRLAHRPEIQLLPDVAAMRSSPRVDVRRAAILAIGPALEQQSAAIETEDLFPWLHDHDAEVRQMCRAALLTRGLEMEQINFAQMLSDPRTTERLKLLTDLRFAKSTAGHGQWLERLSRDNDPAVRLGAARVASEIQLPFTNWLTRLAEQDQDKLVRRWASYYKQQSERIKQTQFER